MRFYPLFAAVLLFTCCGLFAAGAAQDKPVSETAKAGVYSVTLKVLPAESFSDPHREMVQDGGAAAVRLHGAAEPNHHLVAFIKDNGAPVENAKVSIEYRKLDSMSGTWNNLPVVRMYIAGKGVKTTHFGNNVNLVPGNYEARVTVDGANTATYRFSVSG